jgi:TctA family transporter
MDIIANIALGLHTALSYTNLIYCFAGVMVGMLSGVIPGIGPLTAISVLFPITFYLQPTTALIMLGGIWYGAGYGGRIAAILLNIPGTPIHAVMCMDGYPMANQGRAGVALLLTTTSAFIGGSIGITLLMLFGPVVANFALSFGAAEYFSLMLFGLIVASTISEGSAIKALAATVLGAMFGCVGTDIYTGTPRFTFGIDDMTNSISIVSVAMGIYGVAEVIVSINRVGSKGFDIGSIKGSSKPTRDDLRRFVLPTLRGAGLGAFFGILPGAGTLVSSFLSYALEKRIAKNPRRFGKGAVEGIVAPESADNAAEMTGFIPTLTLGIPSSPSMVLMAGALIVQGIQPGPGLMREHPDLFWGVVMSFWIGNVMLVILNVPFIGIWVRMLLIPYRFLFPTVLVFICLGTYIINYSSFNVWMVVFFGILGYLMRVFQVPAAPMLLGFVLGPEMEDYFRRAMLLANGDLTVFLQRPITCTFMLLIFALVPFIVWSLIREGRKAPDESGHQAMPT